MKIKEVKAKIVLDSRKRETIKIYVNGCWTSAPFGASRGHYEKPAYKKSLKGDVNFINKLNCEKLHEVNCFEDLIWIERTLIWHVGANTLFSFEASVLKALAKFQGKGLWQILSLSKKPKIPLLLSNMIGGGKHSNLNKKPDFQEFLAIGNKKQNIKLHKEIGKVIRAKSKDDENAWNTELSNEQILELLSFQEQKFGIDVAGSEFFKEGKYCYKNKRKRLNKKEHIEFIINLIRKYHVYYIEDPLEENDFEGFAKVNKAVGKRCLIVGDDLTTTNLNRTKKAIQKKSINAIIVKPNQIGSLIEMKKVIDLCKKHKIKVIISHRGGETIDDTIADLGVGWNADLIKISVYGKERLAKVNRLEKISKRIR